MTTSGSEANDLALRIALCCANEYEGGNHVAVMEGAYHGHTIATLALSPYKFDGPGGQGKPTWVHVLPLPDVRRCTHFLFVEKVSSRSVHSRIYLCSHYKIKSTNSRHCSSVINRGLNLDGAQAARNAVAEATACSGQIAAFFCESIISCGGQVGLLLVHVQCLAQLPVCKAMPCMKYLDRIGVACTGGFA